MINLRFLRLLMRVLCFFQREGLYSRERVTASATGREESAVRRPGTVPERSGKNRYTMVCLVLQSREGYRSLKDRVRTATQWCVLSYKAGKAIDP